ncbi:hypothetical protein HY571_00900 [Candidatus Micrarchaeota archaeon]|nr:hypothetical protein [Candidatus Micrarchaeota archaeon]
MKKCPVCKSEMKEAENILSEIEGYVFIEKGLRCVKCGEEFISEKEGQKMIQAARKLGLWGEPLKLYRKLSKSARGTVIRLPSDIERALGIKGNEEISISKIGKRICIDISPG